MKNEAVPENLVANALQQFYRLRKVSAPLTGKLGDMPNGSQSTAGRRGVS